MRLPVDESNSPFAVHLRWFIGKEFSEIVHSNEPNFKDQLKNHSLKLVVKAVRLFHDKIDAWHYMRSTHLGFAPLFRALIRLSLSEDSEFGLTHEDRYNLLTFFNHAFNSIEVDFVHDQIKRYLPMSIWINLSETRRNLELSKLSRRIQLAWTKLEEQDKKMDAKLLEQRMFERRFVYNYLQQFFRILKSAVTRTTAMEIDDAEEQENHKNNGTVTKVDTEVALYCQRFIEFVIDLESQLPLRRFFHALMDYSHFIEQCQLSELARNKSPEGHLFDQLVELLSLYSKFDIDLMTGDQRSATETMKNHEQQILALQKTIWTKYSDLKEYAIKPVGAIDNAEALYNIIMRFKSKQELFEFLKSLNLVDESNINLEDPRVASLLANILVNHYKKPELQIKKINSIPLFPNEAVIWDTNLVPDQYYSYEHPLALPKLNLQFLTISDYLLRNFMLFKNESTYEIRQDIEDGIIRSKCKWTPEGQFSTGPKQRMALIIKNFSITEVGEPRLGEKCPSRVKAKVLINMDYVKPEWRREWERLRRHDTCFLVSFRKPDEPDTLGWPEGTFPQKHGVKFVRGCEIEGLLDSEGNIVDENIGVPKFTDNLRTFVVWLDCNQYQMDQETLMKHKVVVNNKFHLFVRREPEKNNFKGVLETIRSLINTKFVVPDWLKNLLIGFGDPMEAHCSSLNAESESVTLDYFDTFPTFDHLKETLKAIRPSYELVVEEGINSEAIVPPFKVTFDDANKKLTVIPYKIPARGPYPSAKPKTNTIRFTPAQTEAITSGLHRGLTMVVGPPGTGKTDVAVQILSVLYHSNPEQRTLIVTHSNQALNQIFGKMIELDVQEHHLLRLGHGEEDLDSTKDFSRCGRVKHVLTRRLELLIQANRLASSLGLEPGQGLTCQSAEYFYSYHIESRWKAFLAAMDQTAGYVINNFPFTKFFDDAPQPLFTGENFEEDYGRAESCFRYIRQIFDLLQAFRPFEIFNNASDRSKYLLIREAKIIAMTCTHAGLRRKELVEMNFQYDNILMEETAQILEIETTIPLLLQNPEHGVNRLKRWIMIGDHNQLPPIIQNSAFQKFSNMEQSLFARFVRLGVPNVELDAQGRARPSLCDLYRWRYKNLSDLSIVTNGIEYKTANAGFAYDYQLINVDDYEGQGETTPRPYFYQNRGEAEFLVQIYKYMRMVGYPNEKITILTTYNGQRELLHELFERECSKDAYIGLPSQIATVDRFQGQQNDFILLSLVRTRTVGHVRDIRRLVVAMSRARLGLYVLGRVSLFRSSLELRNSMDLFLKRPQALKLVTGESYPTNRLLGQDPSSIDNCKLCELKSVDEMKQLVAQRYSEFVAEQTRKIRQFDDENLAKEDGDNSV